MSPQIPNGLLMDVGRLHQILMNLVGNAIKFTQQGEVFTTVSVQEETIKDMLLRFEISDTGIGMTEKEQMSLFQPFSQVDGSTTRLYGGTGLGLSICKELCRLMGGEIGIQSSTKGSGTTFFFTVRLEKLELRRSSVSSELIDDLPPLRIMVAVDSKNKKSQYDYTNVGAFQEVFNEDVESVVERLEHEAVTSAPFNILIIDYTEAAPIIKILEILSNSNNLATSLRILIMIQPCTDNSRRLKQLESLREMNKAGPNLKLGRLRKPPRQSKLLKAIEALLEDKQTPLTHGYILPEMSRKADPAKSQISEDHNTIVRSSNSRSILQKSITSQLIDSSLKDLSILVAEDNPIAQKVILRQLQKFGFQHISLASDGEEVVRKFQSMEQVPHIVFMDLHMPREDGLGATRKIRKWENEAGRMASIPIIALTADVQDSTKENCHAAGMQDVLCKPVSQKQLMAQIIHWSKEKVPLVIPQLHPLYQRSSSSSTVMG
ncbi:hypothetical protein BC937DRAFT_93122 [Endogone sp. FLAS-F59071]|nr:hypothetical protein BC937DRAFT_93122 [Endogone sp. FLAS-F59071]|eukprot:RUS21278.1 hypothetical protein BC937DRAFT_93122 [Endogone sp. FLAS-F59071]